MIKEDVKTIIKKENKGMFFEKPIKKPKKYEKIIKNNKPIIGEKYNLFFMIFSSLK